MKVIDFGIAKSEMSTVKTEAGMIKGKFVYMSPEQSLAKKLDKIASPSARAAIGQATFDFSLPILGSVLLISRPILARCL